MTDKFGTCAFAWQIPEIEEIPASHQPHLRPRIIAQPEAYLCRHAEAVYGDAPMPPPIHRQNCFPIKSGDCEACPHWQAGDQGLLSKLRRKRAVARRRKRKQTVEKV